MVEEEEERAPNVSCGCKAVVAYAKKNKTHVFSTKDVVATCITFRERI